MSDNPLFDGQGLEFHHLQRLDLQKQAAETRRLLEQQEQQRKGVCSCPHCGGGIPKVGVSVCMHCRRNLYWHDGSCGATREDADKNARAKAERVALQKSRQQEKDRQDSKAQAWHASPAGRIEKSKAMGGCLGVWGGGCLVVAGISGLLDATNVSSLGSLMLIIVGVLIVPIAFNVFASAKLEPPK